MTSTLKSLCHILSDNVEKVYFTERLRLFIIPKVENKQDVDNLLKNILLTFYTYIEFYDSLPEKIKNKGTDGPLIDYFHKKYLLKSFEELVFDYEKELNILNNNLCDKNSENEKIKDFNQEYEEIVAKSTIFAEETNRNFASSYELAKLFIKSGDIESADKYIKTGLTISKIQCIPSGISEAEKIINIRNCKFKGQNKE